MLLFYNGSEVEGRANYKPFFDLGTHLIMLAFIPSLTISSSDPISDGTREIPYEEMNAIQVHVFPLFFLDHLFTP